MKIEDIVCLHEKLRMSSTSAGNISLLIKAERGKMYDCLKFSDGWHKKWSELCEELKIDKRTATRYIDFYRLVNAYPRLLICSLSFEVLMKHFKQLSTYITKKENQQLSYRLQVPQKETCILASKRYSSDTLPSKGQPPEHQLSGGAT